MSDLAHDLDVISAEGVAGWAYAGSADVRIGVLVDGVPVGETVPDVWRPDVTAAYPNLPDDTRVGFSFALHPGHFAHVDGGFAEITVELVTDGTRVRAAPVRVPVPRPPDESLAARVPLPPAVARELAAVQGRDVDWDDERAVADITTIVRYGSKRETALYAFLGYIAQVWNHARFVERHFPRLNARYVSGDRDAVGVLTHPEELLAIATHLATLHGYGHRGALLEFGCFKGHSTCVLSFACARLGHDMEVFDSFEGLPPSESPTYGPGEFAGSLEEVKRNVAAFGAPACVRFHKGFFADSLPHWERRDVAMIWMDVDLESSSEDVMSIFDDLPRESAIFTHECHATHFVDGAVVSVRSPDEVLPPILERYHAAGQSPTGRFIAGNTGAIWDRDAGIPVLSLEVLLALRDLALSSG